MNTPGGVEFKAFLHKDGQNFSVIGGSWRATYPISDLKKWFAFYEHLANPAKNKKHHGKYTGTRDALRSVQAQHTAWLAKQEHVP